MSRDNSFIHLYGTAWKKARASFLREFPLCAECKRQGILKPANTVDHIVAHKGDMDLFWDRGNWESLCRSCHSRVTAKRDGGYGNKPSDKAGKACGLDGLPTDLKHHWNR
jgi:5-methylcytosine-specific restriction enzyme A